MYMYRNAVLIARSSKQIFMFKLENYFDDSEPDPSKINDNLYWVHYHSIPANGRIFFMKFNKHIQVTTTQHIYFYEINKDTLLPHLANVMNNFMNCAMMMYGKMGRYCVTYKTNMKSFDLYRRKYEHDFRVKVVDENLEGSKGIYLNSSNVLIVFN